MSTYKKLILIGVLVAGMTSCGDRAVLYDMSHNSLKVIIKGTYSSSSSVEPWLLPGTVTGLNDDSIIECINEPTVDSHGLPVAMKFPKKFMLDIAEMHMNKDEFSKHRDVKSFVMDVNDDDLLNSVDDTDPNSNHFFNGQGVSLKNDDPVDNKRYTYLRLYIRKMAFDGAKLYVPGATGWNIVEDDKNDLEVDSHGNTKFIFNEKRVNGFDFNQLQVNAYYDTLRKEEGKINRVFPKGIYIVTGFTHDKDANEVIEIRILVKNYIKKYEYAHYESGSPRVIHYFALSDWLRDVKGGENEIGGNIPVVARFYNPDKAGSISGTIPSSGHPAYVIAIPAGDPLLNYTLADPAGVGDSTCPVSVGTEENTYTITKNLFSGSYSDWIKEGDWIEITAGDTGMPGTYIITEVTADTITFSRSSGAGTAVAVDFNVYPASDRDQNPCDLPRAPGKTSAYIEPYLDYYLKYEKYKYDWNNQIADCNAISSYNVTEPISAFTDYKEAWKNYNSSVNTFRLPPLAVYVDDGGSYTIENVMPGQYDLYITNVNISDSSRYGELFYNTEFDPYTGGLGNPVTVTEKTDTSGINF